ncbi:hypothetical protein [Methanosarcina barkeri]|uniref:hypothetical protein n=1 Tax=Methanosarcina barkeri TaxID=2208 RepID=UPI000B126EE0|nr:hypothetical protein [Methanosarcina barkeri]
MAFPLSLILDNVESSSVKLVRYEVPVTFQALVESRVRFIELAVLSSLIAPANIQAYSCVPVKLPEKEIKILVG